METYRIGTVRLTSFHESINLTPVREIRRNYNHLAWLLDAQTRINAWADADATISRVLPYVGEVQSSRTAETLTGAIDRIENAVQSAPIADSAVYLRSELTLAGHG